MILFTCTVASFVAQKGARNIALKETNEEETKSEEKILIPLSYAENTDELVNLGITIKSKNNKEGVYALSIIDNDATDGAADKNARKLLHKAVVTAAATDNRLKEIIRYDLNIVNGITSVIKEQKITDLILGLHVKNRISDSFLGKLTEGILNKSNTTTLIYKPFQPFNTLKRHIIVVPAMAEKELGFSLWLMKIWNISRNSGASITFFATSETIDAIKNIKARQRLECKFTEFNNWNDFSIISKEINKNDNLIIVMSRKDQLSYQNAMSNIPDYLNNYLENNSFILIYPLQVGIQDPSKVDFNYPTLMEPIEKLGQLQKFYEKLFKNN
jgi:nucleotide-binding universal stress UspA family protein